MTELDNKTFKDSKLIQFIFHVNSAIGIADELGDAYIKQSVKLSLNNFLVHFDKHHKSQIVRMFDISEGGERGDVFLQGWQAQHELIKELSEISYIDAPDLIDIIRAYKSNKVRFEDNETVIE